MGKWEKVLKRVLCGRSDTNIAFDDLCGLLEHLGFERRTRGSHNIFRRLDIADKPNLQRDGNQAKPYQVKQVRNMILENNLGDEFS